MAGAVFGRNQNSKLEIRNPTRRDASQREQYQMFKTKEKRARGDHYSLRASGFHSFLVLPDSGLCPLEDQEKSEKEKRGRRVV